MSGEVDNQAQEEVLETAAENEEVLQEDVQVESAQDDNPELVAALAKVEEYKEAALRSHADAQNVRRRAEQDVQKAHKFGLEKFAKDIITVADNLERALTAADSDQDAMREGVELTLKSLQETLTRFEVIALDPHGEPFNPEFHQAMTMVPNPEMEPNTVMDVIQKGYTLHGRLIRPAMVVVSSAA